MKIVIGTDLFYPCFYSGGEVHLFNVARSLVKLGNDVTVIAAKTAYNSKNLRKLKNQENIGGVDIIRTRIPFKFGSTISSVPSMVETYRILKKLIEKEEVDIVNPSQYRPCIPFALAAHNNVPCIATFHDTYSEGRFFGMEGWMDQRYFGLPGWALEHITLKLPYDHIITVSMQSKEKLLRYYSSDKISVVYNGVDLEKIDSVSTNKKSNQVIYLGTLKEYKNVLDAIKAVELARKEINDLELIIVSNGGPQENVVKKISKEKKYIKYLGKVTDHEKIRLLKESSLLVFPSSKEGFGLVTIEALSCYTPFIAYDIPTMKEVYSLTKGGVLVKHRDYKAMAEKICYLLNNESITKKLALYGRKEVEKKFTWEEVAKKEAEIMQHVCCNMVYK